MPCAQAQHPEPRQDLCRYGHRHFRGVQSPHEPAERPLTTHHDARPQMLGGAARDSSEKAVALA